MAEGIERHFSDSGSDHAEDFAKRASKRVMRVTGYAEKVILDGLHHGNMLQCVEFGHKRSNVVLTAFERFLCGRKVVSYHCKIFQNRVLSKHTWVCLTAFS